MRADIRKREMLAKKKTKTVYCGISCFSIYHIHKFQIIMKKTKQRIVMPQRLRIRKLIKDPTIY